MVTLLPAPGGLQIGGELEIRGGAGGIAVRLDDLDRAADRLRQLAGDLAACGARALAVLAQVQTSGGQVLDPGGFLVAEQAMASALLGPRGAGSLGAALLATAGLMQAAAAGYRAAERTSAQLIQAIDVTAGRVAATTALVALPPVVPLLLLLGLPLVPLAVLAAGSPSSPGRAGLLDAAASPELLPGARDEVLSFLMAHPELTEHLVASLPGVAGAFGPDPGPVDGRGLAPRLQAIAGVLGRLRGQPGWLADPLTVSVTGPRPGLVRRPASGVAGLIRGIPPSSARDPVIRVDRLDGPQGRHWVVSIPGTDTWSPVPARSPFDLTGAVGLAGLDRTAGITAVETAMREARIPPGEPVLLAGHSQGGMIAAAVAADPAIADRFTITHVLTAGSPIAQVPVPARVRILSLEHTNDLVPALDGRQNPDQENWTTVRALSPLEAGAAPLAGHDQTRYAATAARVDASGDASIQGWRSGTDGFLAGPGQTARSWTLHVRRG